MSGQTVLTLLLYLWIAITVAMVLMWLVRRRSESTATLGAIEDGPVDTAPSVPSDPAAADTTAPPDREPSNPDTTGPDTTAPPDREPSDPDTTGDPSELPVTESDPDETVILGRPRDGVERSGDERHLVSSALGVGLASATPQQPVRSVSDLLADVELPYDLRPVEHNGGARTVYLSSHDDPEDVGTGFADELVRLGYSIEPVGLDVALARRDEDVLHMRIVPRAGTVLASDGTTQVFEEADATDTALEIWIEEDGEGAVRW